MSSISSGPSFSGLDPQTLAGQLDQIKAAAADSLKQALIMLQTPISGGSLEQAGNSQAPPLEAPKSRSVDDLTLRIGLLQDALNQLQQMVSKAEIQGRLAEANEKNVAQLEKIEKQMEEAGEAYRKSQEAQKKSNIFEAIGNWFKAAFDFVCAIFSAVAAIGYALSGNFVAAAGLFVSAAALLASGLVNLTLAIDATVRAAGGDGFLDEQTKKNMQKAVEVLGYISMVAGLIGGLGAITSSARNAVAKGTDFGIKFAHSAMKDAVMQTSSEAVETAVKEATKNAIKAAFKESMKPLTQMLMRQGIATGVLQGTNQVVQGAGGLVVADLQAEAALAQKNADEAEAQAKALEALIKMIHQMIEELQKQMEAMIDSSMDSVSAIFDALDESQESMKGLFKAQMA